MIFSDFSLKHCSRIFLNLCSNPNCPFLAYLVGDQFLLEIQISSPQVQPIRQSFFQQFLPPKIEVHLPSNLNFLVLNRFFLLIFHHLKFSQLLVDLLLRSFFIPIHQNQGQCSPSCFSCLGCLIFEPIAQNL